MRVSRGSCAGSHRPVQAPMLPSPPATAEPWAESFLPQTSKENAASEFAKRR